MRKYLLLIFPIFFLVNAHAQEILVGFIPDNRNENGYYTSLKKAQENIVDVKTLDIEKDDADDFLSNPTTFLNMESLVVHFSKLEKFTTLKANKLLKKIHINYSWNLIYLPDDITELPNLEEITIQSCSLTELPSSFFNSKTLTRACLCYNKLSALPAIPVDNNIVSLFLDINKFSDLPDDFVNLKKIERLSLKDCYFSEFPKEILALKNLKALDLSANNISAIPAELGELLNLETLFLVRTGIKELPESLKKSSLKYVLMSDTNLSKSQKAAIKKSLPKDCEIEWTNALNRMIDSSSCGCIKESYFE